MARSSFRTHAAEFGIELIGPVHLVIGKHCIRQGLFVQVGYQSMADRYAYVPYIGLFIVLAWGLGEVAEALPCGWFVSSLAALCLTASLAAATNAVPALLAGQRETAYAGA